MPFALLKLDITAAEISLPGYSAVRLDRDRHGGGIILFVADIYNMKVLQQGPFDLEFLLVSAQCAQFKLSLAVLYRSPSSPVCYFDNLYSILESFNPALVSSPAAVDCSVIPPFGSSDHLGVQLTIRNQKSAKCTGPSRLVWRYTAVDWDMQGL